MSFFAQNKLVRLRQIFQPVSIALRNINKYDKKYHLEFKGRISPQIVLTRNLARVHDRVNIYKIFCSQTKTEKLLLKIDNMSSCKAQAGFSLALRFARETYSMKVIGL